MATAYRFVQGAVPERIAREGDVTRVYWKDGKMTSVRLAKDDAGDDSAYVAFCIAFAKRFFGTNSQLHRMVDTHLTGYLQDRECERRKAEAKRNREANEAAHRKKVQRLAKRMRLEAEARRYNEKLLGQETKKQNDQ